MQKRWKTASLDGIYPMRQPGHGEDGLGTSDGIAQRCVNARCQWSNCYLCAQRRKILPSPVIKQALEAKIAKLEAEQARKLKKTEKDSLKDEVLHSLLPRAFSRFSQTMMWIDTVNGLIMVDCASAKKRKIRWHCCVKAWGRYRLYH